MNFNFDFDKIKKYVINPVEAREATLEKPETLAMQYEIPTEVKTLEGVGGQANGYQGAIVGWPKPTFADANDLYYIIKSNTFSIITKFFNVII